MRHGNVVDGKTHILPEGAYLTGYDFRALTVERFDGRRVLEVLQKTIRSLLLRKPCLTKISKCLLAKNMSSP